MISINVAEKFFRKSQAHLRFYSSFSPIFIQRNVFHKVTVCCIM